MTLKEIVENSRCFFMDIAVKQYKDQLAVQPSHIFLGLSGMSQVRTLIQQDFKNAMQDVDLLLSPAAPTAAYKIGLH